MKKLAILLALLGFNLVIAQKTVKSQVYKSLPSLNISFSVQSDWVGVVSPGCYTVNIRVYMHSLDQVSLVANQNVNVGDCGNKISNNSIAPCPSVMFKNDYILESSDKNRYCLKELLEDENIYNIYNQVKIEIISFNTK